MTKEEILTNGPDGWTHVSTSMIDVPPTWLRYEVAGVYSVWMDDNGTNPNPYWREMPNNCIEFPEFIRSRNDIEQLAKTNERVKELESALDIALSDKTLELVRCGIGGNYGGSCYNEAIQKYHTPLVEINEQLRKEQE